MAVEADVIYRSREQIAADFMQRFLARIPDAWTGEDGQLSILAQVEGEIIEGIYLANQILRDNIFPQSANLVELRRHGEAFGIDVKPGTFATGTLRFGGAGGTFIGAGREAGFDPGVSDVLVYRTLADVTLPNPGHPTAPTLADGGAGNIVAGTYEYLITFVTAEGETAAGELSAAIVFGSSRQTNLTNIAVGGTGTTKRRVYRQKDGGGFFFAFEIANNTATSATDNNASVTGTQPPEESTAERATVSAQAEATGTEYNTSVGTINELIDVPDGITDVTNSTIFLGGTDPEGMEAYRTRVLEFIRNPQTGSKSDLETWAEEIDGVEEATAFPNDNLGVATNGHVTVRISGPNGVVPVQAVIDATSAVLIERDLANVAVHVTTFTQVPTNVTVTITLLTGYTLADVTANVQQAIIDYINSVHVGGTVYTAGISDAIFGLPGVATVVVNTPATDQTTTTTQKRIPGTLTVN